MNLNKHIFPAFPGVLTVAAQSLMSAWPAEDGDGDDASSDPTSGTVGTGNESRLAMMARIADENDAANADELADIVDIDKGITEPFALPKPGNDDDEIDSEGGETDKTVVAVPKMKVNGVEVYITPELIAKAQKIASADQYLREAAEARAKPSTTVDEPAPRTATPEQDAAELERIALEEERALVRAIQVGTEEEAVAALRKIKASGPSVQQMSRIADERLSFQTALGWFEEEYGDLVENERLHEIVLSRDAALVESGDKRSYKERFKAVGDEVRTWRDDLVKSTGAVVPAKETTATTMTSKERKKQELPRVPVAAGGKSAPKADPDEGDEDPREVIAKMAAQRGGPQWARGLPVTN